MRPEEIVPGGTVPELDPKTSVESATWHTILADLPFEAGFHFNTVFARMPGNYFPGARRAAAAEVASQKGSWPAGGSFTTRADRTPEQANTAATASGAGS